MTYLTITVASEKRYGCHVDGNKRHSAWSDADRGAGAPDFLARRGSCRLCDLGTGETTGRREGCLGSRLSPNSVDAVGHEAPIYKATAQRSQEETWSKKGPFGRSTQASGPCRLGDGSSSGLLSRLRQFPEPLQRDAQTLYRRHSGYQTRSYRAHDSPRLVSEVQEKGRTNGERGYARLDLGQPRLGPLGLAALCFGQYPLSDRGSLQLSSAHEGLRGGVVQMWYRLQAILFTWYEQIQQEALNSAVLFADETSWRVMGKTYWLWCFATQDATYYLIDRSRGSPALMKFFIQEFDGTLVSDFWGAYNAVVCAFRQKCLAHLFRELEHTEKYKSPGKDWPDFAKKLRRLLGDAIRLWRRQEELSAETYASRRDRIHGRLAELIDTPWKDANAKRLIKRFRRHRDELFTFLDQEGVPFDNNHAERTIRPAVIIRKNSHGNRSQQGADCQAVLMSIFRTLKQRGHDPIRTVTAALAEYLTTGQLPPLPAATSDG